MEGAKFVFHAKYTEEGRNANRFVQMKKKGSVENVDTDFWNEKD